MARDDVGIKKHGRAVQIKGAADDQLLARLERFAQKRGIQIATAARMLIKAALDAEGQP